MIPKAKKQRKKKTPGNKTSDTNNNENNNDNNIGYVSHRIDRALFRVRAENLAGWGPWSPSSDALEAQDIILPVKRGATQMLMRWFNKPEGDVLRWELSRRVRDGSVAEGVVVVSGGLSFEFLPVLTRYLLA